MTAALEFDRLGVRLAGRVVLTEISFAVQPGEIMGVLGANGSGKTTLLRAALGLVGLADGEARLGGRPVRTLSASQRAALAGYLPQNPPVGWNMPALDIAALGGANLASDEARRRARLELAEVGLGDLADRGVLDMSGGERARVLIARLLVTGAPLLVADEPAAGLDPNAQFRVMEMFAARAASGVAVLLSLHDLTLAARGCDRLAVLSEGRLVAVGRPKDALTPQVLGDAFGLDGALIDSPSGTVVAARRRA